ncbi:MAG: hypothetical protein ACFB4I_03405 [Cyanophyceae cyanobacterium]
MSDTAEKESAAPALLEITEFGNFDDFLFFYQELLHSWQFKVELAEIKR